MYQSYYHFTAKPFQLNPDPKFFYGSKVHKRAMAYLEYGLSQGEGFIVITGEVGAGKTTLVRNLLRTIASHNIVAAHIVNTHVDEEDILRMVAAAFGISSQNASKSSVLTALEQFLIQTEQQGKRALLIVDEAQNLSNGAVEQLRMLSNFHSCDKALMQTFLIGQPEFRKVLLSPQMKQLQQRVTAAYHLGPLGREETASYIFHRLSTVGWRADPVFSQGAIEEIFLHTAGVPRRINTLCDRLLLMGYLEEIHLFDKAEVARVVQDMESEFSLPDEVSLHQEQVAPALPSIDAPKTEALEQIDERLEKMEHSVGSLLDILKRLISPSLGKKVTPEKT